MILNITGVPNNNTITIPPISLPYGNYSFSLLYFSGFLETPAKFSETVELSCNLITRDSANPHRVISYIDLVDGALSVQFTPTHILEYKLRVLDITCLEFKFRGLASDQILQFSQVVFQIKIDETYARF